MSTDTGKAIEQFLQSRSNLRPLSREGYRRHLVRFLAAFPHLPRSPQELQDYLEGIGGEPQTRYTHYRTLRAMYNSSPDIPNPMLQVRPPRVGEKTVRTFSPVELYAIFSQPMPARDRALLTLLLDTGIRAEEAASITWDAVRVEYALVRGKGGHEREVPLSPQTYRALLSLLSRAQPPGWGRQPVFVGKRGPLTRQGVYKIIKRWCLSSGLSGRRLSPHTLRHTFATRYAEAEGANPKVLQRIMGHRNFKSTLRYLQVSRKSMVDNHRMCTPLRELAVAAQGVLVSDEVLQEAEEILARRNR